MTDQSPTDLGPTAAASADALVRFGSAEISERDRQAALTALITAKVLPKQAGDERVAAGRMHLLRQARTGADPTERLLAIAESIRLGQVVRRWSEEIAKELAPAFESEIPPMRMLGDADDRLNLARACAQMAAPWLPTYLARSVAEEEAGEKARTQAVAALLARSANLSQAMNLLADSFEGLRPMTEAPGDTVARRITRTLSVLREGLLESELEAGDELGNALHRLVYGPLAIVGRPVDEKVQVDLSRESLLTVHDIVRTRLSVVTAPETYRVVTYCRKLCGGSSWPNELKKPLERLITDVSEALVLLGRQGQCDQGLLVQLEALTNPARARALAREISARHPELPEGVRDWLETGRQRVVRQASSAAVETVAARSDESIGLALQAAREVRSLRDSLREPLKSSLEIFEPALAPLTMNLLDRVQVVAVQIEQAAALRGLDLYGTPGEEIDVSQKYFTVVGAVPRQRMVIRQPAVVRKRADGSIGDVVTKGLVE